jgi:signal transduction histidine kinase
VEKSIEISYRAEVEPVLVADPQLLTILVNNLLSNAIKYGREGGRVIIGVREREGSLWLEVQDDGPGVKPKQLSRLFDRFYRTIQARQESEGTGLGLAIVQRIAELYDAEVWAENAREGGLRVTVSFPPSRWRRSREVPDEKAVRKG